MVNSSQLDNCIGFLGKCVVKKEPQVVLDRNKIDSLQFSIAMTTVLQAIEEGLTTKDRVINTLRGIYDGF